MKSEEITVSVIIKIKIAHLIIIRYYHYPEYAIIFKRYHITFIYVQGDNWKVLKTEGVFQLRT